MTNSKVTSWKSRVVALLCGLVIAGGAMAAEGGAVQQAGNDLSDRASLQRGAQLFMKDRKSVV